MFERRTNQNSQQPRRRFAATRAKSKPKWLAYLLVVIAAGSLVVAKLVGSRTVAKVQEAASSVVETVVPTKPKDNAEQIQAMKLALQAIIDAHPDLTIGVAVSDLKYNTSGVVGSTEPFLGASTTKLLTAAAFLTDVENGRRSLSQQLDGYSASWHLQQMINQSNNDSWATLIAAVSYARLGSYGKGIGMAGYDYHDNSLTINDEMLLLQKLYTGKLLNEEHTKLVLGYMQNTNDETMFPAAVTPDITVYHKYGQYAGYQHDVGVLIKDGHEVALVVYTKAANGAYVGRTEVIKQLVQAAVANIFASQP